MRQQDVTTVVTGVVCTVLGAVFLVAAFAVWLSERRENKK